jgi:protein-L-isoaspartate(D-aspartate) O-methyltransferase
MFQIFLRYLGGFVLGCLLLNLACNLRSLSGLTSTPQHSEEEFAVQRRRLVESLKSQGISKKPVLDALLKVPRHKFVPANYRHLSYENRPLPIGHDQTISQPFIVGYMTEMAEIASSEKVLEIGTGSGY